MTPASDTPRKNDNEDIDWRAELLGRVGIVVVVMLALGGGATLISDLRPEVTHPFALALLVSSVILFGILRVRRISPRAKSIIIITLLAAASWRSYSIAGYLPGGALTATFVLVLAALLIGRKTFITLLLAYTALVITLTILVATGAWQGPILVALDPSNPTNWIRTGIVSVILWTSLGFSVLFVINTVEENLARRKRALENLRKEITERRAAESAHREAEEMANQAQKMDAVGQLAAGIAHDFNNALFVIKGWNEIRGVYDTNDEQREATAAIERATEYTTNLSRQLLTFARKDVRTPKYLYLGQFVEGAANSLQHLAGSDIKMEFDLRVDALVHIDESQIQQMIFNLIINARDAISGHGEIRITVRTAAASDLESIPDAADSWILLEIEDDGPGIDKEILGRVFEPFFTTKAPGTGTGLGLSMAHGIVKQSGGYIRLQSRPGRTLFSIFLPTASSEHAEEPDTSESLMGTALDLRVLVIEDDPLARKLIVSTLERNGSNIVECGDGDAALLLLSSGEEPFDLLCLDAVFPGASLADVVEAFEQHSPRAKVLVCSGYVQEEIAIQKLESGEYAYLAKPFTGSRLIQKIREITGGIERPE